MDRKWQEPSPFSVSKYPQGGWGQNAPISPTENTGASASRDDKECGGSRTFGIGGIPTVQVQHLARLITEA